MTKDSKLTESQRKKASKLLNDLSDSDQELSEKKPKTKVDKMFAQKNLTVLSEHYKKLKEESDNSDDDLLLISRKDHDLSDNDVIEKSKSSKKKLSKTKRAIEASGFGTKMVFDETGEARPAFELEKLEDFEKSDIVARKEEFLEKQQLNLMESDVRDKLKEKERRRALKLEKKLKEKLSGQEGEVIVLNRLRLLLAVIPVVNMYLEMKMEMVYQSMTKTSLIQVLVIAAVAMALMMIVNPSRLH